MLQGFDRQIKPFDVLTESQIDAVWEAIFEVAETTGLKFDVRTDHVLDLFNRSGCIVDWDTKIVKFPRKLIVECLAMCPSTFRLQARDPKNDIVIGGDRVYVQPGPGMNYLNLDTFEPRLPTGQEFCDAVRVYDALPHLHYFHPLSPNSSYEGIPAPMALLEVLCARLKYSTKANAAGTTVTGDHVFAIDIAKVVGTNLLWAGAAAPPLTWSDERVTGFMATIEAGFPSSISSGATWGASAPATIAGQIVSASVENIGIVVLAQLLRPGHPVHVKLFTMPQNMRSGAPFFGNIGIALSNAAFHQVWRRYNIPTGDIEPAISNSKCMDFQAGYEKGMLALSSAMSGASTIWIHGTVFAELTAHPVQAIMDDDIAGMIGRFLKGVRVTPETLAVKLIQEVGAGPDFFLNKEHTRKWWQHEQFIPAVADTTSLPEWLTGGKKTTIDLAREKMAAILASHQASIELTDSQQQDIEKILAKARKFYRIKGKM